MNVMDLSPMLNEFDTPFLVDSNTGSYTASPIAEEESEYSEDSTVCDIESRHCIQKCTVHILDKEVSVDEDILAVPLEPTRANSNSETDSNSSNIQNDEFVLPSILRRESSTSSTTLRKVSFPQAENELATYREPENDQYWTINTFLPPEKILQIYKSSCKQHKTIELDVIKELIMEIKNNTNYSATLNLSTVKITNEVNETLEDLLKVANFRTLILNELNFDVEAIKEFLNMLEYYQSICEIEVHCRAMEGSMWKCLCNACSNIMVLESVCYKGMTVSDSFTRSLLNVIESNRRISVLKFDDCVLVSLPYLFENLMTNTTLSELYLSSTGLYRKEAEFIGRLLHKNITLKVLDISNNFIGDRGLEALAKGFSLGCDLSVLVIFNNQITEKSGPIISNIIRDGKKLHTLNIGYNNLTDDVISEIVESLETTTSLEGLGLQCTLLTCKGMAFLASAIKNNNSLQKINLKGNKAIQVSGLEELCQALTNSKITKIEIDETNRSSNDPQAYVQLVKKINAICTANKTFKDSSSDDITSISQLISRKVSLSCEPRFSEPVFPNSLQFESSIKSPVPSPQPTKSRFQITKVQDPIPRPISRFKVTRVISSPDEELSTGAFANVRSSVSSTNSVESLQLDADVGDITNYF